MRGKKVYFCTLLGTCQDSQLVQYTIQQVQNICRNQENILFHTNQGSPFIDLRYDKAPVGINPAFRHGMKLSLLRS